MALPPTNFQQNERLSAYDKLFVEIKFDIVESASKLKDVDSAANKALLASFALLALSLFKLQVIDLLDKVPVEVGTGFLVVFGIYTLVGLILAWLPAHMRYNLDVKPKLDHVLSLVKEDEDTVTRDLDEKISAYEAGKAELSHMESSVETEAQKSHRMKALYEHTQRSHENIEELSTTLEMWLVKMKYEHQSLQRLMYLYRARMWFVFIGPIVLLLASFVVLVVRFSSVS
jgi:hypothetical protein